MSPGGRGSPEVLIPHSSDNWLCPPSPHLPARRMIMMMMTMTLVMTMMTIEKTMMMIRWWLTVFTVLPPWPLLSYVHITSIKDSTLNAIVEKLYDVLTEFSFSIHLSIDCGEEAIRSPSTLLENLMMIMTMMSIIMVMIIMIKLMWMNHRWEEITRSQSPLLETFIRPRWRQLPIRTITFSNSISFLFWNSTDDDQ